MEPGGSMPHSQGRSNNSYPELNIYIYIYIYIYKESRKIVLVTLFITQEWLTNFNYI